MAIKHWKNNKEKRFERQTLKISGVELNISKNGNNQKTRGPRPIFEQDYLKDFDTMEEIKKAITDFRKDYPLYDFDIVMQWAIDAMKKRGHKIKENRDDEDER